jgi:tetratricopeptide (TPR) repeat protein
LQSGRYQEAQRDYERALAADGKSTDALLRLATLAARQGRIDEAQGDYARALETDPADATAQAGVLSTRGQRDAQAEESQIKTALAGRPDSPPLNFALGNLYARQQRWSEAQEAYFQAYAGDPDNPDIIFNLAVSLDHLRQDGLAVRYYRMAIEAGEARTPAFDRNQATSRIEALQP